MVGCPSTIWEALMCDIFSLIGESTYGNMSRNPPKGRNPAGHLIGFERLSIVFNANVIYVRQRSSWLCIELYLVGYLRYALRKAHHPHGSQARKRGRGPKKTHEALFWRSAGWRWAVENCININFLYGTLCSNFGQFRFPGYLCMAPFSFWDVSIRRIYMPGFECSIYSSSTSLSMSMIPAPWIVVSRVIVCGASI
jgi:hypothetical protein